MVQGVLAVSAVLVRTEQMEVLEEKVELGVQEAPLAVLEVQAERGALEVLLDKYRS